MPPFGCPCWEMTDLPRKLIYLGRIYLAPGLPRYGFTSLLIYFGRIYLAIGLPHDVFTSRRMYLGRIYLAIGLPRHWFAPLLVYLATDLPRDGFTSLLVCLGRIYLRTGLPRFSKPAWAPWPRGSIPSGLLGDSLRRTGELRLDTPVLLDDDELLALVAYTYDNQSGKPDGQFYQEVNRALRNRRGRKQLVQRWGGVLYYLMAALTRLPDMSGLFYRVCPDRLQLSNYPVGGRIQYGASLSGVP